MLKRRWNPDGKANNTNTDRLDWVIDTCHKTLFYSTQQHTTGWIQHQHVPNSTYVKRTVSNFLWWRICVIHSHRSQVANNNVRFWNGSVQGAKKFSSSAASMLRPAAEQLGCSTGSRVHGRTVAAHGCMFACAPALPWYLGVRCFFRYASTTSGFFF